MCPLQVSGLRAKEIEPICLLSSEQRRLAIRSRRHDRRAAGHLGGLLRKAPLTILGGIPPSPPAVALAVSPSSFPLPRRGWNWVTWNAEPRREFGSRRRHTCLQSLSTWHGCLGQIKLPWEQPEASSQMHWCGASRVGQVARAE